jgi:hypothetical protein
MNKVIWYLCLTLLFLWALSVGVNTENAILLGHTGFDTQYGLLVLFEVIGLNLVAPIGIYFLYKKQIKDLKKAGEI